MDMKYRKNLAIYLLTIIGIIQILSSGCNKNDDKLDSLTDIDGNKYDTIAIGKQVWMIENLKTTRYRNGDPIQNGFYISLDTLTSGAFINIESDLNMAHYGYVYNWFAIRDPRNIAPKGWHVATVADWNILTEYLGGASVAGGKLKEIGTKNWESPNTGASDEFGFKALPGGYVKWYGEFCLFYKYGCWWSSTESKQDSSQAWFRVIYYDDIYVGSGYLNKKNFLSVRCVKDE